MSFSKKYIEMQDMILARTALEKVKMHIKERKDKTIFKWVSSETQEFIRKFRNDKDLHNCIEKLISGIENEKYEIIENNLDDCIRILSEKIDITYSDLMNEKE
ncbi:hypothetical protein DFR86_05235 [Acidianus sulfidivorans JP7]|uniref:Uncharacterized protein n=1 Tax=Acidianus sulfidivorans JP7 TaxID=619593 RepID=A0A2U9ILY9_9CREN|nr:hypothetical protein [Acidianus sulfidivorans]AWR97023.1 hypothetical protein DFR86_05235 [Acidianus sulfidivorans JP7]